MIEGRLFVWRTCRGLPLNNVHMGHPNVVRPGGVKLVLRDDVVLLCKEIVKRLVCAGCDAPLFAVETDAWLEHGEIGAHELLLVALTGLLLIEQGLFAGDVPTVLALRGGDLDLGQELLFSIKRRLCRSLLLQLHLHGTGGGWTCRLEWVSTALGHVFPEELELNIVSTAASLPRVLVDKLIVLVVGHQM